VGRGGRLQKFEERWGFDYKRATFLWSTSRNDKKKAKRWREGRKRKKAYLGSPLARPGTPGGRVHMGVRTRVKTD